MPALLVKSIGCGSASTEGKEMKITRYYKYIHFELVDMPNRKTSVFLCRNNSSKAILGQIKWYGPWRQYCFFPNDLAETVFNVACLQDICHFIGMIK